MGTRPASRWRRLALVLLLVAVAVVGVVTYTGYEALQARRELQQVTTDVDNLQSQLNRGQTAAAAASVRSAQRNARAAREHTRGPGWWVAARLPGVGPDVTAVRTVTAVADDVSRTVLPDAVTALDTLRPASLRPVGGRIDLAPIRDAADRVVRADARLQVQSDRVQAIDTAALSSRTSGPVRSLQTRLAEATALSDRASRAVRLLPGMLGGDGPRRYLLMFQNNAEVRSTGGIPGSFAIVEAEDGALSLGLQGDAGTVGQATPRLRLTREELALFGPGLGTLPQDVTSTPDFPRAAELIRTMWRRSGGGAVDGVVSVDPVALSYLLRGTGPLPLEGGGRITADDAVPTLLSRVYSEIPDPSLQNVYFDSVAKTVFAAVVSGQGDAEVVQEGLVRSVRERRMLVWSARSREQSVIAGTPLAGGLEARATRRPAVGVYLNNKGLSKLDYYLDTSTDVSTRCVAGRQRLRVSVALRSRLERGATIPDYVANQQLLLQRDAIRLRVYVYAPVGGRLTGASYDGDEEELDGLTHRGRQVVAVSVDLPPQQQGRLVVDMVAGPGQDGPVDLQVTPGVRGDGIGRVDDSGC